MKELKFIEWLKSQTKTPSPLSAKNQFHQPIPIGDDGALHQLNKLDLVTVADMLLEGTHFDLARCSPYEVGRKALAVNLSDMAAMGANPRGGLVSLGLPQLADFQFAEAVMTGILDLANQFHVTIVGGDTNVWAGSLVVAVTVYGEPMFDRVIARNGAQVGDWIMVTGSLGKSYSSVAPGRHQPPSKIQPDYPWPWSGAHHLWFEPRLEAARELLSSYSITSMIDLSDGLGTDLNHILKASQVGANLQTDWLPCRNPSTTKTVKDQEITTSQGPRDQPIDNFNRSTKDLVAAVSDGEDFELCCTLAAAEGNILGAQGLPISQIPITRIGTICTGSEMHWQGPSTEVLRDLAGYEH